MEHRCPECGTALPEGVPAWVRQLKAADVMTRDPVTLAPEDSLMRAVQIMRMHGIRRLPIVVGGAFMGLVAGGDLKSAQPSTLSDSQEEFNKIMEETPVSRIMIREPACVAEETSLFDVARMLETTKYGALPVVRDGRLVGIVTDHDIIRCFGDLVEHGG